MSVTIKFITFRVTFSFILVPVRSSLFPVSCQLILVATPVAHCLPLPSTEAQFYQFYSQLNISGTLYMKSNRFLTAKSSIWLI